jgi:hypothetical protein
MLPRFLTVGELASASAATMALLLGCYFLVILSLPNRLKQAERSMAREIEAVVPTGVRLYAVNADYKRFLVHLGFRVRYLANLSDLPAERPIYVATFAAEDQTVLTAQSKTTNICSLTSAKGKVFRIWRLD